MKIDQTKSPNQLIHTVTGSLALMIIWILAVLVVNPRGDFPLNDDWSYATTAIEFARSGEFKPSGFTSMPLITNVLMAYPFLKTFGSSFETLHFLDMLVHYASTAMLFHFACRFLRFWQAMVIALAYMFCSLAFVLSFTFMTETIFAFCLLVFLVIIHKQSRSSLILSSVAACLCAMSRQTIIPMLLVPTLYFLAIERSWRRAIWTGVPLVCASVAYVALKRWLESSGRMPLLFNMASTGLVEAISDRRLPIVFVGNVHQTLLMVGFLCAPAVLLFCLLHPGKFHWKRFLTVSLVLSVTLVIQKVVTHKSMLFPYMENVINDYGFGPITFAGGVEVTWQLPPFVAVVTTVLSIAGAAGLVDLILTSMSRDTSTWSFQQRKLSLLFLIGLIVPACMLKGMYDRYLIPICVVIVTMIVMTIRSGTFTKRSLVLLPILLIQIAYDITLGHDYFAINRAKNEVITALIKNENANPKYIDGGFEHNGFNNYSDTFKPTDGNRFWITRVDYKVGLGAPAHSEPKTIKSVYLWSTNKSINIVGYRASGQPSK
jgi:hypothetical protein